LIEKSENKSRITNQPATLQYALSQEWKYRIWVCYAHA